MISAFQFFLTLLQFFTNMRLVMRWFKNSPNDGLTNPRSIQVGLQPDAPSFIDEHERMAEGIAVPEADRELNKAPIFKLKQSAIFAIPVEDGDQSGATNNANVFKQSIYDHDELVGNLDSAQKMTGSRNNEEG